MYSFQKTDIPSLFRSHKGTHFERCISCDTYLLEEGTAYIIEKAVRQYKGFQASDVLFEYAMCLQCVEKMRQAMSEESLKRVQQYFEERVDIVQRQSELENDTDPQRWLSHCIVSGKPLEELTEYQVYALCDGRQMQFSGMPYLLSGEVVDEMAELLSDKTLGEINRFIDENFGLPPEFKKPIKDHPVVFL